MAQHCHLSGCEDGGHPPALAAQAAVPDGVDASVDAVEPPGLEPTLDDSSCDAGIKELAKTAPC